MSDHQRFRLYTAGGKKVPEISRTAVSQKLAVLPFHSPPSVLQ